MAKRRDDPFARGTGFTSTLRAGEAGKPQEVITGISSVGGGTKKGNKISRRILAKMDRAGISRPAGARGGAPRARISDIVGAGRPQESTGAPISPLLTPPPSAPSKRGNFANLTAIASQPGASEKSKQERLAAGKEARGARERGQRLVAETALGEEAIKGAAAVDVAGVRALGQVGASKAQADAQTQQAISDAMQFKFEQTGITDRAEADRVSAEAMNDAKIKADEKIAATEEQRSIRQDQQEERLELIKQGVASEADEKEAFSELASDLVNNNKVRASLVDIEMDEVARTAMNSSLDLTDRLIQAKMSEVFGGGQAGGTPPVAAQPDTDVMARFDKNQDGNISNKEEAAAQKFMTDMFSRFDALPPEQQARFKNDSRYIMAQEINKKIRSQAQSAVNNMNIFGEAGARGKSAPLAE